MSDSSSTAGISVPTTSGNAVTNAMTTATRSTGSDLDKDAFLKLLLAELQNQDPLEPMDNTEFVSQMAQFSALEQMQNLNTTMTSSQAYGLIGKKVYASVYDSTTNSYNNVEGVVDYVSIKNSTPYLSVDGNEIEFGDVQYVYNTESTDNNAVINQALNLIGKTIQAITVDSDYNASEYVEGTVDYVKFVSGSPVLSVNGKDVFLSEVASVSDGQLLVGSELSAYTGEDETVTGTVDSVKIDKENLYLVIGGKQVAISDLSSVMTALSYVGKEVTSKTASGTVDGVIIKEKTPYLKVGENEVKVSDVE